MEVSRVQYYVQGAAPPPPERPPERLTVASFNVENWFDRFDDPARDEGDTPPKPEEAKRAVAAMIREAGADVVTLQEMENKSTLDELADSYLEPGRYPYRLLVEGNDGRGIDVAILSRYPISRYDSHTSDRFPVPGRAAPGRFSRDFLHARLDVGGMPFSVFTTHLKAGRRPEDQAKRLAEAQRIREILTQQERAEPGLPYVVTGDFNDGPDTAAVREILGTGAGALVDPFTSPAGGVAKTHPTDGALLHRYDYILASGNLRGHVEEARVLRDPQAELASDHFPVTARFHVTPWLLGEGENRPGNGRG